MTDFDAQTWEFVRTALSGGNAENGHVEDGEPPEKLLDVLWFPHTVADQLAAALRTAHAEGMEVGAKIADLRAEKLGDTRSPYDMTAAAEVSDIAHAIRALKDNHNG